MLGASHHLEDDPALEEGLLASRPQQLEQEKCPSRPMPWLGVGARTAEGLLLQHLKPPAPLLLHL